MSVHRPVSGLHRLARAYGVQTSYEDVNGGRHAATPVALLHALGALGAPVHDFADVPEALRAHEAAQQDAWVEPVAVVPPGAGATFDFHLPESLATGALEAELDCEDGRLVTWTSPLDQLELVGHRQLAGQRHVLLRAPVRDELAVGYHHLTLRLQARQFRMLLLAAPPRAYQGAAGPDARQWGVFLPLYALHTEKSWGAGDLGDLRTLSEWVAQRGGHCVASLPIQAAFPDHEHGVSPYAPATRLFWDENYLDVAAIPELADTPAAAAVMATAEFQAALAELCASPWVDYRRQAALKRAVLEPLAAAFFAGPTPRRESFDRFVARRAEVEDYAQFRAACEKLGRPWMSWPEAARDGTLARADFDSAAYQYHLYSQWLADEALQALSAEANQRGLVWYLDLPLGVHGEGFDVWRHRDAFAASMAGGAPPDAFFTRGQNWGFPPMHPHRLRESGYRYWIDVLRHQLQYTGLLRIDHVMGLHRLYWVPHGLEATDGVYVRYEAEELYAILKIESHRRRAWLVGENLGTVPRYVDRSLARHGIHGLYVLQFGMQPDEHRALLPVPRGAVASVNTHDLPMFAAFWEGHDIDDRLDLELLSTEEADVERAERAELRQALVGYLRRKKLLAADRDDAYSVVAAALEWLSATDARLVLVNIEDLWQELAPHNVPGTLDERRNWCRRARYSLEQFAALPEVQQALDRVRDARLPAASKRNTASK